MNNDDLAERIGFSGFFNKNHFLTEKVVGSTNDGCRDKVHVKIFGDKDDGGKEERFGDRNKKYLKNNKNINRC